MDEGRVVAWHCSVGDTVREGDVLFEVETDKATMEVPSPVSGILRRIVVDADVVAPVAGLVALIATTADEPVGEQFGDQADPEASGGIERASQGGSKSTALTSDSVSSSAGPGSSRLVASQADRVTASPAARKAATELGVDLATVVASRPPRITIEDVEAAARAPAVRAAAAGLRRTPLSRMRRAIAVAMTRSAHEVPQFSIERDVDMGEATKRRRGLDVSYTDIIVSAVAQALASNPRLRARFDGDALVETDSVHVGLAVAVDGGLIVPVIRDADGKDLAALRGDRERLEAGARTGRLSADDLLGAVFTVSNLGSLGVDRFTALVNPPEAGILACGRVRDQAVVRDGVPVARPMMTLSLSVDHRVADGADAARFMDDIVQALERA